MNSLPISRVWNVYLRLKTNVFLKIYIRITLLSKLCINIMLIKKKKQYFSYTNIFWLQLQNTSILVPHVKSFIPLVKSTSIPLDQACEHHGTTSGFWSHHTHRYSEVWGHRWQCVPFCTRVSGTRWTPLDRSTF